MLFVLQLFPKYKLVLLFFHVTFITEKKKRLKKVDISAEMQNFLSCLWPLEPATPQLSGQYMHHINMWHVDRH